ncbi:MAG: hypothetical protein B7X47_10310 [Ferrovum sp. 34-44-207]|nr:MAG: hypothetical protein B7X47_10310 [Ferrovum sp. 34-44-207]
MSALGITSADASKLREVFIAAAEVDNNFSMPNTDAYGCRYALDSLISFGNREAIIRSAWIIKVGEDYPRLVSCYVLRGAT